MGTVMGVQLKSVACYGSYIKTKYIAARTKATIERCLDGCVVLCTEATYTVDGVEKAYVVVTDGTGPAGPFEIDLDEIAESLDDYTPRS